MLLIFDRKQSPTSTSTSTFSIELDDEPLLTCFLNHPTLTDNIQYPLDYHLIHERQLLDIQLILNQQTHPLKFPLSIFMIFLICFVKNPGDTWRIATMHITERIYIRRIKPFHR